MRISFDIDDTLVCSAAVPSEGPLPLWRRWSYPESVRRGTRGLLVDLVAQGHEIWVYTTSFRSERYLRGWFRRLGVTLGGVVNQTIHDRVVGTSGPSKYPPAFGIALHVDDSEGVEFEGQRHGFDVLRIEPDDREWTKRVLAGVCDRVTARR